MPSTVSTRGEERTMLKNRIVIAAGSFLLGTAATRSYL